MLFPLPALLCLAPALGLASFRRPFFRGPPFRFLFFPCRRLLFLFEPAFFFEFRLRLAANARGLGLSRFGFPFLFDLPEARLFFFSLPGELLQFLFAPGLGRLVRVFPLPEAPEFPPDLGLVDRHGGKAVEGGRGFGRGRGAGFKTEDQRQAERDMQQHGQQQRACAQEPVGRH